MKHYFSASFFGIIGVLALVTPAEASVPAARGAGQIATFEGQTFDMSRGWGQAVACNVTDGSAVCYRSETEMNKAIAAIPVSRASSCTSSLRLYDGTGRTGAVVNLSTRMTTLTLSTFGFDNRTSSYRIGGCSAILYSGIGSGSYGGNTAANASASSMLSGWDNTVSSVYIN
jgi:hypothetical protein